MVKNSYEGYLILRKLDFAFPSKMENAQSHRLIANTPMGKVS